MDGNKDDAAKCLRIGKGALDAADCAAHRRGGARPAVGILIPPQHTDEEQSHASMDCPSRSTDTLGGQSIRGGVRVSEMQPRGSFHSDMEEDAGRNIAATIRRQSLSYKSHTSKAAMVAKTKKRKLAHNFWKMTSWIRGHDNFHDKAQGEKELCRWRSYQYLCFVAENFCLHMYLLIYENFSYIGTVDVQLA